MKTATKWLASGIVGVVTLFLFYACSKNNSGSSNIPPGKSQVSIYMMDDPIQFTKVLIDIRQVAVLVDTSTKQSDPDEDDEWGDDFCGRHGDRDHKTVIWDTLNITPGVYDLLKLRNGADTLLASGLFPSGKILKIRVTLGPKDTVYTDSTTYYPLAVFGDHPYFTINVRRENLSSISNNDFKLWLDFNLDRSIFFWNGEFLLSPYIVVFNDQVQAKIKGQALPVGKVTLVTAFNSKDTLYAIPSWGDDDDRDGGNYLIRNAPAGTYSINFKGRDGYKDTTITNISVTAGETTKVPTITLHK